jgi:O-antigen/teichoic acid export membrane protein
MNNILQHNLVSKMLLLIGNTIEKLASLVTTILLAKFLTVSEFGELTYTLAFVGVLCVISLYGYSSSVVFREVTQGRTIKLTELRNMAILANLTYLAAVLVLIFISKTANIFTNINVFLLIGFIVALNINFFFGFITSFYTAKKNFGKYGLIQIFKSIALLMLNVILVMLYRSEFSRLWADLLFFVFFLPIIIIFINRNTEKTICNIPWDSGKIKYGVGLSVAQLLNILLIMTDRILIGEILSIEQVGFYVVLSQILAFQFLTNTVNSFYTTDYFKLAKSYMRSEEHKLLLKMFLLSGSGLGFVAIIAYLYLKPLFSWLELPLNRDSNLIILLLLISLFIWNAGQILLRRPNALGMSKPNIHAAIWAFLLNLSANLVLLEKFGILGAAYASVLGMSAYFLVSLHYFIQAKNTFIREDNDGRIKL